MQKRSDFEMRNIKLSRRRQIYHRYVLQMYHMLVFRIKLFDTNSQISENVKSFIWMTFPLDEYNDHTYHFKSIQIAEDG